MLNQTVLVGRLTKTRNKNIRKWKESKFYYISSSKKF